MTGGLRPNLAAEMLRRGYVLLTRLGEGATSQVYEAKHQPTGRRVALKVSRADVPEAEAIAARIRTAWNVARGLRHPHLVATLDGGTLPDGRAWVAMERLVGHDLQVELDSLTRLPPTRAVHIARQVCEALLVLHRRGAIHRDVKPENVFLCAGGHHADHVKLVDLGVIAVPDDDPNRVHEPTGRFIMGTPLYLAPELARGKRPDPRSDLYSVGAVLYHLIAGRPPFEGEDPTEVVSRHVHEAVEPLDRLVAGLPPSLVELVHACLEKDPDARPADAAEVMVRLDGCAVELTWGRGPLPSFQQATIPPIPPPGHAAEWERFAHVLEKNIAVCWHGLERPAELDAAVEWVASAGETLKQAAADAERRRESADLRARERIAAQARLDVQQRHVGAALKDARAAQRAAAEAVEQAAAARDALDEQYREVVEQLRALGSGPVGAVAARDCAPLAAQVRELLAARNEADEQLRRARDAEQRTAEEVASLLAEQVEIDHALTDLSLEEQDEGCRAELLANRAADTALAAQRAFENACLRLYLEYVEQATHLRG